MTSAEHARYRMTGRAEPPIIRRPDNAIISPARRTREQGPMSVQQAANARREADYVARRNGIAEPKIKLWRA